VRFQPGQSGNPGGRKKGEEDIRELARQHTAEALAALVWVATKSASDSARVTAAVALLDRGYGRPAQPLANDLSHPITNVESAEERAARLLREFDAAFGRPYVPELNGISRKNGAADA
jgi:hypothetical protein